MKKTINIYYNLFIFTFILFIIFTFILCFPVNASTIVSPDAYFKINNVDSLPYTVNNGSSYSMEYSYYFDNDGIYYNYLIIDLCTEGNYQDFYIVSDACNQSCFESGKVTTYKSGTCTVNNNSNANKVTIQIKVKKGEYLAVDSYYRVANRINLGGSGKTQFISFYGSDADVITSLASNQQNTQDIINNQNNTTNTIIQNNNDNTQQIIDSNKVCEMYDKNNTIIDGYIQSNGSIATTTVYGVTDYIKINNKSTIELITRLSNGNIYSCFYNVNKERINCFSAASYQVGDTITIPNNTSYVRFSIYKTENVPTYKICKDGNQATNDAINGLNDNITNSNIDSPNSDFSDMEDMIAENGVITNLLSLPITLYSKILNSVNGTCSSYNLGTLFGTSITFSCISLQSLLGNTIWGVIDILFSGFTIYAIAKKMIKVFNSMSSLKEGDVIDD